MPTRFSQHYILHPIGQGMFYTGILQLDDEEPFYLVFDCGSVSFGNQIQNQLKKLANHRSRPHINPTKAIDLLVISHFDRDHINGLPNLLANRRKVRKVVAPYLSPEERLAMAILFSDEDDGVMGGADTPLIKAVLDPIAWLDENGSIDSDTQIILVQPGSPPPPEEGGSGQQGGEDGAVELEFGFDLRGELLNETDGYLLKGLQGQVFKTTASNKGRIRKNNFLRLVDLIFYTRKDYSDNVNEYLRRIGDDTYVTPQQRNDIRSLSGLDPDHPDQDYEGLKALLRAIHGKCKSGLGRLDMGDSFCNAFALGMSHCTSRDILIKAKKLRTYGHRHGYRFYHQYYAHRYTMWDEIPRVLRETWREDIRFDDRVGTLLTSDLPMNRDTRVRNLYNHFAEYWHRIQFVQVPHHGSRHSSITLFYQIMPSLPLLFVNYGIGNQHGHPTPEVRGYINTLGLPLIEVNQHSSGMHNYSELYF